MIEAIRSRHNGRDIMVRVPPNSVSARLASKRKELFSWCVPWKSLPESKGLTVNFAYGPGWPVNLQVITSADRP